MSEQRDSGCSAAREPTSFLTGLLHRTSVNRLSGYIALEQPILGSQSDRKAENGAVVVGASLLGGSVEIAIRCLNKLIRTGATAGNAGAEGIQSCQHPIRSESEYRPTPRGSATRSAGTGCSVKIAVTALNHGPAWALAIRASILGAKALASTK